MRVSVFLPTSSPVILDQRPGPMRRAASEPETSNVLGSLTRRATPHKRAQTHLTDDEECRPPKPERHLATPVREPGSGEQRPSLHGQDGAVGQHWTTATLRPGPRSGELGRRRIRCATSRTVPPLLDIAGGYRRRLTPGGGRAGSSGAESIGGMRRSECGGVGICAGSTVGSCPGCRGSRRTHRSATASRRCGGCGTRSRTCWSCCPRA